MPFDNILEFVEGPRGLNWTLLPVQRFILKLHYGMELDAHDARIHISDHFQERPRYSLTEVDYLSYLHGEGRCNVEDQSSLPRPGLVLAMGRRTGKSRLAQVIASYTVTQMLQMGNPHAAFGFPSRHILNAASYVGLGGESNNYFIWGIADHIERCSELREAVRRPIRREVRFTTPEGRSLNLGYGSLSILALEPRSWYHGGTITLILDDLAHMPNEQEVVRARIPMVLPSGRYAMLSTPRRPEGAFYNHFQRAMGTDSSDSLALQIPTWEVQRDMSPLLRQRFEENPTQFYTEYGARWHHPHPHREVHIELRV